MSGAKLSAHVVDILFDSNSSVYISIAALWEITIKQQKGRLSVPEDLGEALDQDNFQIMPVSLDHVRALRDLPEIHSDPFDRIMITQALCEGLTLITRDKHILKYDVQLLKA